MIFVRADGASSQAIRLGGFVVSMPLTQFSQNTSGIFAVPYITGTIGANAAPIHPNI
jgi:hypothetical protein